MINSFRRFKEDERVFFSISAVILCLGLVMVYSSSYIFAVETYGSSSYLFSKQIVNALFGGVVFYIVSKTKFDFWCKHANKINIFVSLLVISTFLPLVGVSVKGSSRWLNLFFVKFQPGELLKYTTILMSVYFTVNFKSFTTQQKTGYFLLMFFPICMLALQPDFGSFIICFLIVIFIGFLSEIPRKLFYSFFIGAGMVAGFVLTLADYRVQRLLTFLDPWKSPKSSGFQIIQSYLAFSNGGIFGLGIGNSNEKLLYLPEAHNDFIFSVVGEEFGFIGVFIVVSLFVSFIFYGFKIALGFNNLEMRLVSSGVIFLIGIQAMFNMGVVLGLLPTKGLNLPFFSYGGSSLICNFFGLGLIVSALKKKTMRN